MTAHEPERGQDPDPPDLQLALHVTIVLLGDVHHHLDPDYPDGDVVDLVLRLAAVRAVLRRLHQHNENVSARNVSLRNVSEGNVSDEGPS